MDSSDILSALKKRDLNFSIVGEALDPPVSPQHVAAVAARTATSKRVAQALARAIGKRVDEVFGDVPGYRAPKRHTRQTAVASLKRQLQDCA